MDDQGKRDITSKDARIFIGKMQIYVKECTREDLELGQLKQIAQDEIVHRLNDDLKKRLEGLSYKSLFVICDEIDALSKLKRESISLQLTEKKPKKQSH